MESCVTIGEGVGGIVIGYWIKNLGFLSASYFLFGCNTFAILLFVLLKSDHNHAKLVGKETNTIEVSTTSDSDICHSKNIQKENLTGSFVKSEIQFSTSVCNLLKSVWKLYTTERINCTRCKGWSKTDVYTTQ